MLEISEYVNLNGVKQYILATGNEKGPLMLFLHGGPGVSQSGFIRKYQSKLEEDFLVVNWDQRGAGKSNTKIFSKDELKINNKERDFDNIKTEDDEILNLILAIQTVILEFIRNKKN